MDKNTLWSLTGMDNKKTISLQGNSDKNLLNEELTIREFNLADSGLEWGTRKYREERYLRKVKRP